MLTCETYVKGCPRIQARLEHGDGARGSDTGRVTYVGHATVLLELDGVRLLTDPVLRSRLVHLRRQVAAHDEGLPPTSTRS